MPYIYVHGVDAALERVKVNGGEIVRPPYREGDLWVATFRDPAGNVVGGAPLHRGTRLLHSGRGHHGDRAVCARQRSIGRWAIG